MACPGLVEHGRESITSDVVQAPLGLSRLKVDPRRLGLQGRAVSEEASQSDNRQHRGDGHHRQDDDQEPRGGRAHGKPSGGGGSARSLGRSTSPTWTSLRRGPRGKRGFRRSLRTSKVVDQRATIGTVPRPTLPPPLAPRQPKTILGWTMQKLRLVYGATVRQIATEFGCSASHISRVERGDTKPSRSLAQFYEERFEADGLLLSLFEVA